MDDYRFFDEISIPPQEAISARISFENARILARFYQGSRGRVRPAEVKDPLLSRLAHQVRRDGTVSVKNCLRFLEMLERIDGFDLPPVTVESEVYALTPVEPPACPVFNFIFDGIGSVTPLMQADDRLYSYDGEGIFLSEEGDFFCLPETRVIDAYLDQERLLPSMAFSMFYRIAYPTLEREEHFRLYSSLRMVGEPPLTVEPEQQGEGLLAVRLTWCVPYPEIRFFPDAAMLCECRGELRPSLPMLKELPPVMQRDGIFTPDHAQYGLLLRYARAMPAAFTAPLPAFRQPEESIPPLPEPPAAPQKLTPRQERRVALPGGIQVTVRPAAPLYHNRSVTLGHFLRAYGDAEGQPCKIVPFSAFSPEWSMLDAAQRACYLYLRSCYMKGEEAPHAGYAYLLLLIYEAVNLPDRLEFLFRIWNANRAEYQRLDIFMPGLVRDYMVLHAPEAAFTTIYQRVKFDLCAVPHPELYLDLESEEGLRTLPPSLLAVISGYDVTKSRFFTPEAGPTILDAFGRALVAADRAMRREEGRGLFTGSAKREMTLRVTACSPAVMLHACSAELIYHYATAYYQAAVRDRCTAIFKTAENEWRSKQGVKGRLRVSGLSAEVTRAIREELNKKDPVRVKVDISAALSIEKDSWSTTDRLIAAAGTAPEDVPEALMDRPCIPEPEATPPPEAAPTVPPPEPEEATPQEGYAAMVTALSGPARGYLKLLLANAGEGERLAFAAAHATMPDTLEEEINEQASLLTGDILIEGGEIIEDYRADIPVPDGYTEMKEVDRHA